MFERFTDRAQQAVTQAQEEARSLRHGRIGTEHLLLGVAGQPASVGQLVLARFGLDAPTIRSDVTRIIGQGGAFDARDQEALRAVGIDLDEVRRAVEDAFGPGALERPTVRGRQGRCTPRWTPGHLPFSRRAKKCLELSARWAVTMHHSYIGTEHILLGLATEREGVAGGILRFHGLEPTELRAAIEDHLARGDTAS
jgi:ATP-dependent Clp protease ATP-binding subunit ClpA